MILLATLLSIYKPIIFLIVFCLWAYLVSNLDKDLAYYYLRRHLWNAGHIAAGVITVLIWVNVPFWIGLPLALLLLGGPIAGYVYYRNLNVPPDRQWTLSIDTWNEWIHGYQQDSAQRNAQVQLLTDDGTAIPVPTSSDTTYDAHNLFEDLLAFALPRGAERIDLAVDQEKTAIAVRIDGVSYAQPSVEPTLGVTLVDYLRDAAGMDTADRRRKQTADLPVNAGDHGKHKIELHFAGSSRGMQLVMEFDRQKRLLMPIAELGLTSQQQQQVEAVLESRQRTVLVAAPPHQGLSTTLYSLVNAHDPYTQTVGTLEENVIHEIEGVSHEQIEPGADNATINKRLTSILRGDPHVLMLSRLIDTAMARQVAESSDDVRFYVGLPQDSGRAALKVWLKAVGDLKDGAEAIEAIISQRLVRKLCTTCRIRYKPDAAMLKKMNLPADKVKHLFKPSGKVTVKEQEETCPDCLGMAYRGRVGVFEVMTLDDEARGLIAKGSLDQLHAHLRKQRMMLLQEAALSKVIDGTTSISEVTRALGKGEKPAGKSAAGTPAQT